MEKNLLNNYENNRGEKNSPQKKNIKKNIDFKLYKKNTIKSLNDVEFFLNNFNHYFKYFKLFKLFK